jgi:hypothetical protein
MPDHNWTKLPNELIEALHIVETLGELMVVLYVLRHTWGFQKYGITKRITLDEFQHGRKRRDSSRLDSGTGLSPNCLKDGIRRAVAHGFLLPMGIHCRDGKVRYSHQLRDGTWCNGRREVEPSPVTYREWTPEERDWVNTCSRRM